MNKYLNICQRFGLYNCNWLILRELLNYNKARRCCGPGRFMSIMARYKEARNLQETSPEATLRNRLTELESTSSGESRVQQGNTWNDINEPHSKKFEINRRDPVPPEAKISSWIPPVQPAKPKGLTVALIGPPNAGKSSLLNAILGESVSAVSPKVNTTRFHFRGILTEYNCQISFIDAPGIIGSHERKSFSRELVSSAWRGYEEADVGLFIVDTVKRPTRHVFNVIKAITPRPSLAKYGFETDWFPRNDRTFGSDFSALAYDEHPVNFRDLKTSGVSGSVLKRMSPELSEENEVFENRIPIILCLNKIDLASQPKWIYAREKEYVAHGNFDRIFRISAKYKRGINPLVDYLTSLCTSRIWMYPQDMITTLSKVQQVEQLIRTYIFCWFNKDLPYHLEQETIGWTHVKDGVLTIEHDILVRNENVSKIICGIRGRIIAQMSKNVSYKLERLWGHKVELILRVRPLKRFQK